MGGAVMVLCHFRAAVVAFSATARAFLGRAFCCAMAAALCVFLKIGVAGAQEISLSQDDGVWGRSRLVDLSNGGLNSEMVKSAASGGFDLSGGQAVDLQRWYTPQMPNLSATFMTEVSSNFGVIWGGAWGERGEKYTLGPTAALGVVFRQTISDNLTIEMEVSGIFGGRLRESACTGNFGIIGGVQRVNCRLAASLLPPKETLDFLWNEPDRAVGVLRLGMQWRF